MGAGFAVGLATQKRMAAAKAKSPGWCENTLVVSAERAAIDNPWVSWLGGLTFRAFQPEKSLQELATLRFEHPARRQFKVVVHSR
ncbi:MAG: hypothetical protein RL077_6301 [Verrucomicrobiota bacterium]